MRASIIVITRNRSNYIEETFAALRAQNANDFEIIVVDSSGENERKTTTKLAAKYEIRYIYEPRHGQALARNVGVTHASGDIIAFTDDDCVPAHDWLAKQLEIFSNPSIWACTGRVIQHNREGAADLFEEVAGQDLGTLRRSFFPADTRLSFSFLSDNVLKVFAKHMKSDAPVPFGIGHGSSMSFRREVFKQIGDFNVMFGNSVVKYAIEDIELFYRILKAGHSILYEPAAVVSHKHKLTAEEVFKTRYIYSYSGAALMWKYRRDTRMSFLFWGRLLQLLIKNVQYKIQRRTHLAKSFGFDLRGFLDGWAACRQLVKQGFAAPVASQLDNP
jgi:glycosyltransferase involved in cell wall biosynthesis